MKAITARGYQTDAETGLTLPLSRFLGSQELERHRAMVAVELEVLAKKLDRFGWDRDRGSMAHDRLISDWMDALQDFPLDEVQSACRKAVIDNPKMVPHEGHIIAIIRAERKAFVQSRKRPATPDPEPVQRVTAQRAVEIMAEVGIAPKRFGA